MKKLINENGKLKIKLFASCAFVALSFALSSCDTLQEELSSERLIKQNEGIGSVEAMATTYYYNGTEKDSVKGNESHLVLSLSQLADAEKAKVTYTLSYKMDDVDYSSSGTGEGTLSASKSQYYVNLKEGINLIDGTEKPKYSDISFSFKVLGLLNASGNDYDGRSFPSYSGMVKFAPLYTAETLEFDTNNSLNSFEISLNGEITAVEEEVTATSAPDGVTFTARKSDDGKKIIITSSEDLKDKEFTADFLLTGIKPLGAKETYSHTFSEVVFEKNLPSKQFSVSDLSTSLPKRALEITDIEDLNVVKISFSWTGSPSWITGIASTDTSSWGDSETKIENITTTNKTLNSNSSSNGTWAAGIIEKIKQNGLNLAGDADSVTITVYYNE